MQEWREYRKRTIDSGQAWNMHVGSRQDAGSVDSSDENRRRILLVAEKIEEKMAELAAILEANCKRQDELVASRDGVGYSLLNPHLSWLTKTVPPYGSLCKMERAGRALLTLPPNSSSARRKSLRAGWRGRRARMFVS